jgi:hypothetical protein
MFSKGIHHLAVMSRLKLIVGMLSLTDSVVKSDDMPASDVVRLAAMPRLKRQ